MAPVDLDECIARIMRLELLGEDLVKDLCDRLRIVLVNESNVQHVAAPVTVVGDVHGGFVAGVPAVCSQFHDVLELFKVGGMCPDTNYLFLGDYVDRGYHGVETIALLVCLKLRYPNRITLLRGNHETRTVTQVYGFYKECVVKYGNGNVWKYFTDLFDYLTVAAIIDNSIFCVHGGLSPSLQTIDQIRILDRFQEIPTDGPLADLMWSDPHPDREDFALSERGAGFTFGRRVVARFCEVNQVQHILRAHQLCQEGYQVIFDDTLSTVWSAPNYCYRCGNLASILQVSESLERTFNMFEPSEHSVIDDPTLPDVSRKMPDYFL